MVLCCRRAWQAKAGQSRAGSIVSDSKRASANLGIWFAVSLFRKAGEQQPREFAAVR